MTFTRREVLLAGGLAVGGIALGGGIALELQRMLEKQTEGSRASEQELDLVYGVCAGNVQWGDTSRLDAYIALVGAQPRIVNVFQAFKDFNGSYVDFSTSGLSKLYARYPPVMLSWEPRQLGSTTALTLDSIVEGAHDAFIVEQARRVVSLRRRILIRWGHEMNISQFLWGQKPYNYRVAWKRCHGLFASEGANQYAEWVWCPNVRTPITSDAWEFAQFYPGDEYVDWLGLDGYNWAAARNLPWFSFGEVFSQSLAELRDTVNSHKKVIICEYGCHDAPGDKGAWFAEIPLALQQVEFANLAALVYFHSNRDGANWRVDYPPSALEAYRELIMAGPYLGTPL